MIIPVELKFAVLFPIACFMAGFVIAAIVYYHIGRKEGKNEC